MECPKYTYHKQLIHECLEELIIKTGKTGDYKVVFIDKFKRQYEFTGITTGDITISLEFGELHYSLLNRFAGAFEVLIYIDGALLSFNCPTPYNALLIEAYGSNSEEITYTIDLIDCK